VALVTDKFWTQGAYVAKVAGLPEIPRVQLPHPIAGRTAPEMQVIADEVSGAIVEALR
jgi:hypothetical protein